MTNANSALACVATGKLSLGIIKKPIKGKNHKIVKFADDQPIAS